MNIKDMTPVQIDEILAPIWEREANAEMRISNYKRTESEIFATIEKIKRGEQVLRYRTVRDGIELMEKLALLGRHIVAEGNKLAAAQADAAPYVAEYISRGGWNRVFVAQSHNGHAHNGQNCSTCHNGESATSFAWLIRYSGLDEAEIVADAGERACTTCYPTAPAADLARPTKMFTPDEEEAAKARAEREAAKAERARQADAKSITTPEGGKLYEDEDNSWACKTLRTAETKATDALVDLITTQRQAKDPQFAFLFENGRTEAKRTMEHARHAWCLIRSIAAKKGQTFEETFQVHEKKAQAKIRKQAREWAKDPRNPNRSK